VKKIHIRYGTDYSCLNEQNCFALRADEFRFVAMKDAFAVTDEVSERMGLQSADDEADADFA
jgi:hypothetical protein